MLSLIQLLLFLVILFVYRATTNHLKEVSVGVFLRGHEEDAVGLLGQISFQIHCNIFKYSSSRFGTISDLMFSFSFSVIPHLLTVRYKDRTNSNGQPNRTKLNLVSLV